MDIVYSYDINNLVSNGPKWDLHSTSTSNNNYSSPSKFDILLFKKWNLAAEAGLFRYSLKDCDYKLLGNTSMQFVAQLNPQRAFNRRKRELFNCMNASFSNDQFNFTKIKSGEKLFTLKPGANTALGEFYKEFSSKNDHVIAINVSPIDDCHILLIPELNNCLPQKITVTSVLLAFDLIQLSNHPGFRLGFNSIHAWASINHLHFHAVYFDFPLFIDNYPVTVKLVSYCYLLDKAPMPGFIFNISSTVSERIKIAKEAVAIIDLLHDEEIPYNVIITRGECGTRLVIIPRKSTKHKDPSPYFDVACLEIGGQFPVKSKEAFENISFDLAFNILAEDALTKEEFCTLVEKVQHALS